MSDGNDGGRVFGKHRGTVVNNIDPRRMGRLQVEVPAVYGPNTLNWAMPCAPYAGRDQGLFLIPPIGAKVWVEFEGGDIDYPIWAGGFWGEGECPGDLPTRKLLKTPAGELSIDELNPAEPVTLSTPAGHRVTFTAAGVTIETAGGAKIELTGPQVSVNSGALEVV
ncbi:MAG: phage baseplate assembly protein V [Pseudomonadota bacterium]